MPKSKLGKWALGLVIAMPIFFVIGSSLGRSFYDSVPAGNSILDDIFRRPSLSIPMLLGFGSGISAFVTGSISILKHKDRAILVLVATTIGALLIAFLIGEFVSPH